MSEKNEVRIIRESGKYHVFLGTTDVWIGRMQLELMHDEVRKQLAEYDNHTNILQDEMTFITSNLRINGDILIDRYGDMVASRNSESWQQK